MQYKVYSANESTFKIDEEPFHLINDQSKPSKILQKNSKIYWYAETGRDFYHKRGGWFIYNEDCSFDENESNIIFESDIEYNFPNTANDTHFGFGRFEQNVYHYYLDSQIQSGKNYNVSGVFSHFDLNTSLYLSEIDKNNNFKRILFEIPTENGFKNENLNISDYSIDINCGFPPQRLDSRTLSTPLQSGTKYLISIGSTDCLNFDKLKTGYLSFLGDNGSSTSFPIQFPSENSQNFSFEADKNYTICRIQFLSNDVSCPYSSFFADNILIGESGERGFSSSFSSSTDGKLAITHIFGKKTLNPDPSSPNISWYFANQNSPLESITQDYLYIKDGKVFLENIFPNYTYTIFARNKYQTNFSFLNFVSGDSDLFIHDLEQVLDFTSGNNYIGKFGINVKVNLESGANYWIQGLYPQNSTLYSVDNADATYVGGAGLGWENDPNSNLLEILTPSNYDPLKGKRFKSNFYASGVRYTVDGNAPRGFTSKIYKTPFIDYKIFIDNQTSLNVKFKDFKISSTEYYSPEIVQN